MSNQVKCYLKKDKPSDTDGRVTFELNQSSKRYRFTAKGALYKLPLSDFDRDECRVKENGSLDKRTARMLTDKIQEMREYFWECFVKLSLETKLTSDGLKQLMYEQFFPDIVKSKVPKLLDYIEELHIKTGKKKTRFGRLHSLLNAYGKKPEYQDINSAWIREFVDYCKEKHLKRDRTVGLSSTYIEKNLKTLKEVLNEANARGYHENMYFNSNSFVAVKGVASEDTYLTEKDLELLATSKLPATPDNIDAARWKFLLICFTGGQRISDRDKISLDNIVQMETENGLVDFFKIRQKKTSGNPYSEILIPVEPMARYILERHSEAIKTDMHVNTINRYIKRACRLSKIDYDVTLLRANGPEQKLTTEPKYKFVTSKTARKTFVTLMTMRGYPKELIKAWTGHSISSDGGFEKYRMAASMMKLAIEASGLRLSEGLVEKLK